MIIEHTMIDTKHDSADDASQKIISEADSENQDVAVPIGTHAQRDVRSRSPRPRKAMRSSRPRSQVRSLGTRRAQQCVASKRIVNS